MRFSATVGVVLLALNLACGNDPVSLAVGLDDPEDAPPGGNDTSDLGGDGGVVSADKIDAPVRSVLSTGASATVLILGSDQLLPPPNGYQQFIAANASAQRRALRTRVVSDLKSIAANSQAAILGLLGDGAIPLWIVNGVGASVTADEADSLARLESVAFIYDAGSLPPVGALAGTVAQVLTEGTRSTFTTAGKIIPWNLEMIGARRVWEELGLTGEGVTVALFDNGVNYTHQDLRNNIWINSGEVANNGIDDDGNRYVDDYYGFDFRTMSAEVGAFGSANRHGTFTSGIVAGDGSGGIVTGVAPRARIMPLRAAGLVGAALAHEYALENGADIMTMSFSLPNLGNARGAWRLMSEHATAAGLVSVSGAGNFQQNQPIPVQQRIPEGIPSVISVGGVDSLLNLVPFSSLGPVDWSMVKFYGDHPALTKPDVSAFPGAGYPILDGAGGGYIDPNTSIGGNSFSGPHVAGIAALMLSAQPDLPAWRVQEVLEATATDLGTAGKDNETGAGLANAYEAVRAVR